MLLLLIAKALLVGFVLSLFAIGASKVVAMQRTFLYGPKSGAWVAAGSSLADLIYASITTFGLSFFTFNIADLHPWMDYLVVVILVGFGIYFAATRIDFNKAEHARHKNSGSFGLGLSLNILNPGNVVAFSLGLAYLGITTERLVLNSALAITAGIVIGSMLAWALQIYLFHRLRHRVNEQRLNLLTRGLGVLLIVLGLASLYSQLH